MNISGVISYKSVLKKDIKFPPSYVYEWSPDTNKVEKKQRDKSTGWLTTPQVAFEYCKIALPIIVVVTPWPDELLLPGALNEVLQILGAAY